ncbi:DUF2218 domain-containing protein [Aureimonas populi]|uniref:DUF2218 domain-containing protein n=1 Tax=Aureimonas populi TaxID=1701758 RepID=A0ABW5CQW2_9HYPH|nr:DUF2218 domain-containing protein [Aureimonas populi]
MMTSRAVVQTPNASRYLQQLCKHWSHKFDVSFDANHGSVPFPEGRKGEFAASENALTLDVSASDEAGLRIIETVVANHLERFAFREELAIEWQPAA